MSNVLEVNSQEELASIIADNDCVVVDFAAPAWCRPCVQFAPHFDKASEKSDATFVAVDVDKAPWAMAEYGVQSVPTVKLFCSGEFNKTILSRTIIPLLAEISS